MSPRPLPCDFFLRNYNSLNIDDFSNIESLVYANLWSWESQSEHLYYA